MKALNVLIVEDDTMIGLVLAEVLEGLGHSVCAIEPTEAGAVIAAHRCKPDLMIVDVWLGDGNGVAAVEEIRRTNFIPHIIVSADLSKVRGLRADAVVLQKPFREADLERAMQRALDAAPDDTPPQPEKLVEDAKPIWRPRPFPRAGI
jgi:DNA-binding response OmpR family regulator